MTTASEAYAAIEEFVKLARTRRTQALDAGKKARMEALDEVIREVIDGARPAPKRIENPTAVKPKTPEHGVAPAKIQLKASQALEGALALSTDDKRKLSSISVDDLPKSAYTPPTTPAFMADYYSDSVVPARIQTGDLPTHAVSAGGDTLDLAKEVRVLLGLERPEPEPEPTAAGAVAVSGAPARPAARAATPAPQAPPKTGIPVIVHLLAGGTVRARVEAFDPASGEIALLGKDPSKPPKRTALEDVLAIFFGTKPDDPGTPEEGTALVVKLTNDRQITGVSPDYSEGADALKIVPNPRRGSIDHVWVPAWAVKEIALT